MARGQKGGVRWGECERREERGKLEGCDEKDKEMEEEQEEEEGKGG